MRDKILKIAFGGVLTAVIMLATFALKVPIPNQLGYFNLGDGVIFGVSAILGPFAAICAGLGSALADLTYAPIYIPGTFLIKGAMGLLAGFVLTRYPKLPWFWQIILFIACEAIMVAGYFTYESLVFNTEYAIGGLLLNSLQGAVGVVLGLAIVPLARRLKTVMKL
jgi:uncharacterized membrane protein